MASTAVSRRCACGLPAAAAPLRSDPDTPVHHVSYFKVTRKSARKEVVNMPIFKIMRIYEVPGDDQIEATNRMMEALMLGVESDWHVTDYIKSPEDPKGKGSRVNLKPPKGWMTLVIDQLLGRHRD